jgi:lactose/L-arabinose transport system permease protein
MEKNLEKNKEPLKPHKSKSLISKFFPNQNTIPYYFLLPIILLFLMFMVYPIIDSFLMSFQQYKFGKYSFVGLSNYKRLVSDPTFRSALGNNFIYLLIQVPIMIILALIISELLNKSFLKFRGIFRMAFFMPAVTALVAYALVFKLLLNTNYGFINYLLALVHIPKVDWLNRPMSARASIIIAMIWRWTGYNMVILLAGLQGISGDIYEACDIDGANAIQKFFKITLPLMKPIILFCVITSTIGTLQLFDEPYILTQGGPDNATITVANYLYNTAFRFINFGYASAISYVLVVIIAVFSLIQFKFVGGGD